MADPPRNLTFEASAPANVPDGWVLEESGAVREFAGFATTDFQPVADPNMAGWPAFGGSKLSADPPYNPMAGAQIGNAVEFTEDFTTGSHGMAPTETRVLEPGGSYTFGVYMRAFNAGVRAGPVVVVCPDCALGVVYSFDDDVAEHVGWVIMTPADPAILNAVAATVSRLPGTDWVRVALSFRLADDADAHGLGAESGFGAFLFGDAAGAVEYEGAGRAVTFWGAHFYEGALAAQEGYAAPWIGSGYLSVLQTPTPATFPAASGSTTYEGYDRWAVPYLDDLSGYLATVAYSGAVPQAETYADGWGTDNYASENSGVVYSTAGEGGVETYAVGWGTDNYVDLLDGQVYSAWAGDLALGAEAYSPAYPEVAYTALPATDQLSAEGHGLVDDARVRLSNAGYASGAQFPAPLSPHVSYYVVNATADDFQLSTTVGGAAVGITSEGTGEQFAVPDPRRYWILTE